MKKSYWYYKNKSFLGKDVKDCWFYLVFALTIIILGLILFV
jgi:hypothetical protein